EVFPTAEQAAHELATAFDEAAPDSPGPRSGSANGEACVLTVPATAAGERLKELARQAVPEAPWGFAQGRDQVIVYRAALQVPLADLPQLGQIARDAYQQMKSVEHFTPHARTDIPFDPDMAEQIQNRQPWASDVSQR